ncbi:MAG: acyltransferase [Cellulosilyticum sp.]|nr:acyltransferase [Cellulosilyticum sp.]
MRKNYIDHLRVACILLLFPFHTCRIFTEENFYVHVQQVTGCELFVQLLGPWFMPLLFLLAGMSTYLALGKRSNGQYIKERVSKLFMPCICGVLLTVPIQTYYAEKYHNAYTGTYFEQLKLFFTKETDLTGYTGGFTPAHLWFLFVLFVISVALLPIIVRIRKMKRETLSLLKNPVVLLLMIIPITLVSTIEIATIAIGKYMILFLLGAMFCTNEDILETIKKYRACYLGIMLLITIQYILSRFGVIPEIGGIFRGIAYQTRMWATILTLLGYAMKYWNTNSRIMNYFKEVCFPIYEVHQTILVVVAYYIVNSTSYFAIQYVGSLVCTFIISIVVCEILRSFRVTRWMFAIKERTNPNKDLPVKIS